MSERSPLHRRDVAETQPIRPVQLRQAGPAVPSVSPSVARQCPRRHWTWLDLIAIATTGWALGIVTFLFIMLHWELLA